MTEFIKIEEFVNERKLGDQKKKSKDLIYCYRKNSKNNEEQKKMNLMN